MIPWYLITAFAHRFRYFYTRTSEWCSQAVKVGERLIRKKFLAKNTRNGSKRTKNGSVENWRIRLSPAPLSACFMAKTEINPRLIKYYVIISAIKVL